MAGDMTPVFTDILRNVWLIRNPFNQSETIEVKPYSVPLVNGYFVKWADVCA